MQYRRAKVEGGTFFFTVVTCNRAKILTLPHHIPLLRQAFRQVKTQLPFDINAIVILPDHLHCIWTLPPNDSDFSTRWQQIKSNFTRHVSAPYHQRRSASRLQKGEQGIWQRRFWEHQIRDEKDLMRHTDYIYYNPVRHRLVNAPKDWKYSSFHRDVQRGIYSIDWGDNPEAVWQGRDEIE
jgi:putative transposase